MSDKNKEIILYKETSHNYNFIGENNLKEIYNEWDLFINWSENIGNSHYAFTVNYPNDKIHKKMFYINTYRNILALHPLEEYEKFTLDGVLYDDYGTLERDFTTEMSWFDSIHYKLDPTHEDLLTTWIFTIVEENKEGYVHLHGILAIKNIIDYNKNMKGNLLSMLKSNWSFCDVVIKDLNNFKDIKGWVRYLHQNNRWVFKPIFHITNNYVNVVEKRFLIAYKNNYNLKNTKKEVFNGKFSWKNLFCDIKPFGLILTSVDKKIYDFIGIKLNKNEIVQELFLDLVSNYMVLNNLFINKNNIYKKLKDSFISYELIGTIEYLLFDNFQNIIIPFFTSKFPIHFNNFDFYFLIKNFKNKMESDILKIKNITNNNIELDFNLMEFKDGIYNISRNTFISKKDLENNISHCKYNLCTIKYYDKSYNRVRQDKPINWINGLKNALGEDNFKDFFILCVFIANIFQPLDENIKRNFLYIYGKSNSGKTTLLSKVIYRYFGEDNIGTIVSDSNFKFQDINNKLFIILEEFRYKKSLSSDFLKLLGGEKLLTSKKYSKNHISIEGIKGLIVSNEIISEKDEDIKRALENRLYIINFINKVLYSNDNVNNLILSEEAHIIIFCNKLLFKLKYKKHSRFNQKDKSEKLYKSLTYNSKHNFGFYKYKEILEKIKREKVPDYTGLKMKYGDHWNIRLQFFHRNERNIITETKKYIDVTATTKDYNGINWILGKDPHNQFCSANHMALIDSENMRCDSFLNVGEPIKNSTVKNILEQIVDDNPDNVEIVESDLTKMFSQHFNDFTFNGKFQKCLEIKSKSSECLQIFNIKWGCNAEFFMDILFRNYK